MGFGVSAVILGGATFGAACGPVAGSRHVAVAPHVDPAIPTGDFASPEHRAWGQKAGTAMSVMRGFLNSMQTAFVVAPPTRDRIIEACGTAVAHLPELEAAIPTGSPDPELGREVNEAVAGFEQYIRSCAAGDDTNAEAGLDRYEDASQAVYNLVAAIK